MKILGKEVLFCVKTSTSEDGFMFPAQTYKPLNPFKLLGAREPQLRQWESEGRIRIHTAVPGENGAAYIEIVKPN